MRYSGPISWIIVVGLFFFSGCALPHSDVMLFGTDSQVALDVSANPEQGNTPHVTIGYKRREFVWMPLLANAIHSKLAPFLRDGGSTLVAGEGARITAPSHQNIELQGGEIGNVPPQTKLNLSSVVEITFTKGTQIRLPEGKTVRVSAGITAELPAGSKIALAEGSMLTAPGAAGGIDILSAKYVSEGPGKDGKGVERDTYSVLAAFGADIKAGASQSGVGIAQYFATGIAARRLAELGGDKLVTIRTPTEEELRATTKRAESAEKKVIELSDLRTSEFVEKQRQKRVDEILDKIIKISDQKAFDLNDKPPVVKSEEIEKIIDLRDPAKKRLTGGDAKVAREMLKMRVILSKRSDADLDAWEAALTAVE